MILPASRSDSSVLAQIHLGSIRMARALRCCFARSDEAHPTLSSFHDNAGEADTPDEPRHSRAPRSATASVG